MVEKDYNAIANMPQQVIMKEYPRYGNGIGDNINDNLAGVDGQIYADDKGMMKGFKPRKV